MKNKFMLSAPRERLDELVLVRAFAIIGVLSVHATSFATKEMLAYPASYYIYTFFNIFLKFGTPVFIFLSSLVLFLNYYPRALSRSHFGSFYKKRLLFIGLPYICFSAIYYAAVALTRTAAEQPYASLPDFISKLLTGTAYSHLYFIFINIQFYALFPLLLLLFQKLPRLAPWALPIGLAGQWGFYAIDQWLSIPRSGSWSLTYFSFYMFGAGCGMWLAKRKGTPREDTDSSSARKLPALRLLGTIGLWTAWTAVGLWHVHLWFELRLEGIVRPNAMYALLWNLYALLSAVVLLQAALCLIKKWKRTRPVIWLMRLGELSFGVYLLHPLLLAAYRELRPVTDSAVMLHLWYGGGFLLALLGTSLIVAFALRRLPFAWILFGKNEQQERRPAP